MTTMAGVAHILSENVVYKLDLESKAWVSIARIPGSYGTEYRVRESFPLFPVLRLHPICFQLHALDDGRLWVRHDEWHKSNWIIENGLAWQGPTGPLGRVSNPATVPLGENLFFVSGGNHEAEGWRDSSRTFILSMNVVHV